jgi:hypothetical protein
MGQCSSRVDDEYHDQLERERQNEQKLELQIERRKLEKQKKKELKLLEKQTIRKVSNSSPTRSWKNEDELEHEQQQQQQHEHEQQPQKQSKPSIQIVPVHDDSSMSMHKLRRAISIDDEIGLTSRCLSSRDFSEHDDEEQQKRTALALLMETNSSHSTPISRRHSRNSTDTECISPTSIFISSQSRSPFQSKSHPISPVCTTVPLRPLRFFRQPLKRNSTPIQANEQNNTQVCI